MLKKITCLSAVKRVWSFSCPRIQLKFSLFIDLDTRMSTLTRLAGKIFIGQMFTGVVKYTLVNREVLSSSPTRSPTGDSFEQRHSI